MTLDYDKFASFEHAVLSDLYRKLHARTNLSMAEVLSRASHLHHHPFTPPHIITLVFTPP